jgi:hypothetical protein
MRIRDEAQKTEARREVGSILVRGILDSMLYNKNAETSVAARVFKP